MTLMDAVLDELGKKALTNQQRYELPAIKG